MADPGHAHRSLFCPEGRNPHPVCVSGLTRVARALAFASLLSAGCAGEPPAEWQVEDGYRWRALADAGSEEAGFTALPPERTRIAFSNDFSEVSLLDNDILANGSGVALGDFDDDGRIDVYLASVEGGNVLYRNLGDLRFEDVTVEAGVGLEGSVSRGATWADMDGDGDLDLLVTRHSEPNVWFQNDGDGTFTDISEQVGFVAALASHGLALADADLDGDLDLYITNYKDRWVRDTFAPAERAYDRTVGQDGERSFIRPGFEDYFRLIRTDQGLQRWEFAQPDEFYLNDGGRLRRVPFTDPRFSDETGARLQIEPDEWGLSVRFVDLDLDGDADLYVCNDINSPDHIWLNDGAGNFRWIDPLAIRKTSAASMAVDIADVDRDGWPDIFVAEMLSPDPVERKAQVPEVEPNPPEPGELSNRPQVKRNTLQMNRGDGTFAEVAYQAGVAASGWTWGVLFLDVDLDGFEDLLAANGTVLDWLDGDAQERTQGVTGGESWRRLRLQFPPLESRNLAFRNRGDGTFENAGNWGFGLDPDVSHGMAAGDLDGDGDLDVVVNRLNATSLVLRNDATAPRVAIRLVGAAPNTRGIGAYVRFAAEGLPEQGREVAAGGLYLSDSDDAVVFAAPSGGTGTVTVTWPGGGESRLDLVEGGRLYEISETGVSTPIGRSRAETPLFEDASALLDHRHHDTFWNEFTRQPLLPYRLAQLGPGVSWIDEERDGHPELWIGTGRGGAVGRFVNVRGQFRPGASLSSAPGDITAIVPSPPGTGGQVIAGLMNYEAEDSSAGIAQPSAVTLDRGRADPFLPGAPSTTGPLALADYDGDGDLDLFVGGRTIPSAYPIAAQGRFFRNDAGRWALDDANADAIEGGALISAAAFSDVDIDGDPDLLLATEWGPVRLLLNEGGRFVEQTSQWGLAELIGRWNGLATGDLNEDGKPDIVVTAWGENTEAQLHGAGREILHGDIDLNGVYDVIELELWDDGSRAPTRRLDQIARGLPFVRRITTGHRDYAAADIESLLPGGLASTQTAGVTELRHTVFMSGDAGYTARPLPAVAQRAPAFGVAIADLDGDGHHDVVLAQNFFATRLETPRYDAGRGLLLLGDGSGQLEPVEAGVSGFAVYGDGRGLALADYDDDGRLDLVVGQNAGATRLFHNVGAIPGLRLRLEGPAGNPDAVGAVVRIEYASGVGPAHEVQSGSGYWSHDELAPTLGFAELPVAVLVRWPGGAETRTPVGAPDAELVVRAPTARPR